MDYEKAYKEALSKANKYYNANTNNGYREIFKDIFHELKESEDERIGKELYDFITCQYGSIDDAHYRSWISWITKHKQEPVEQDTEVHDLWVYIREWNDKFGRLPKDEDELAACIDYVMKRQKPADKVEQKHAWSEKHIADVFEKVGLARIVREQGNDQLTNAVQSAMIELSKQQNPACSEEDRKHIDNIISLLNQTKERFVRESGQFPSWITEIIWLESIKDRIQPQQEWSEYDKIQLSEAIEMIEANGTWIRSEDAVKKVSNWLKSLKERYTWKPSDEQLISLGRFIEGVYGCNDFTNIKSLYQDLEKL